MSLCQINSFQIIYIWNDYIPGTTFTGIWLTHDLLVTEACELEGSVSLFRCISRSWTTFSVRTNQPWSEMWRSKTWKWREKSRPSSTIRGGHRRIFAHAHWANTQKHMLVLTLADAGGAISSYTEPYLRTSRSLPRCLLVSCVIRLKDYHPCNSFSDKNATTIRLASGHRAAAPSRTGKFCSGQCLLPVLVPQWARRPRCQDCSGNAKAQTSDSSRTDLAHYQIMWLR